MTIQSVQRVSDILSLFSIERPRWGITDIANTLGLAKTTVSSLVRTLHEVGFLEQDRETRRYSLGPKIFVLGIVMSETLEINQRSEVIVRRLAQETGLLVRVSIWDRDAVLVTLNVAPQNSDPFPRRIGPRVMAYCSAIGKALLAHLDTEHLETYLKTNRFTPFTPHTITRKDRLRKELKETKLRGYAINNQEVSLGRASIAAPIFKRGGRIAASISLSGTPEQIMGDEQEKLVQNLMNAAEDISRQMGYSRMSPSGMVMNSNAK